MKICIPPRNAGTGKWLAVLLAVPLVASAAEPPVPIGADPASAPTTPFGNGSPVIQNGDVLPLDQAFTFTALVEADGNIVLMWEIQDGYYLYQKSLAAATEDGMSLALELPPAEDKTDEFFGEVKVYHERLLLRLPLRDLQADAAGNVALLVSYQGCAEERYCYPPAQKQLTLALP